MKKILFIFLAAVAIGANCKVIKSFDETVESNLNDQGVKKNWAVLVAGSNTYSNYRHQANVLHAYQLLQKKHGIPKEQIVLMMYDDLAYSEDNPFKGNVINVPDGENLYSDDLEKDYIKDEVTPDNFLKVLLGDEKLKKSGKKVLQSNENDHVFVYYTDHGGDGLVAFPSKYLYATSLIKTLKQMKSKKMYKKLVFYLEACESGSMFEGLLDDDLDIYAVTSAKPDESTYATYYDEKRMTYLSDEFSSSWFLDIKKHEEEEKSELLSEQFENVKSLTKSSTARQYGDLKIASQFQVSDFLGTPVSKIDSFKSINLMNSHHDRINSREVEFYLTRLRSLKNNDNKFEILQKNRNMTLNFINQLKTKLFKVLNVDNYSLTKKSKIENRECYEQFVDLFNDHCASITKHTYLLRHLHIFKNTCNIIQKNEQENVVSVDTNELKKEIKNYCKLYKNSFSKISSVV